VGPFVQRLQILGATNIGGPPLEAAFQDLVRQWGASEDRPERELALLRTLTAPRIAVALSLSPTTLEAWVSELNLSDPLWTVLGPDEEDRAMHLRTAMDSEDWAVGNANRSYLFGRAAQEIGEDTLALRLFSRLDSLVFGIDALDAGWGLLALSYVHRGRSYDTIGEPEMAAQFYRRFVEAWSAPDMQDSLAQEARRRLDELSRSTPLE
jgi:hypothetical protein